ncbi:MFS transporter [Nakamurella sp.]|uniref:MFS transporter n=1 Tax=Nakamurella sp. TaxID=1869182 RepID=UPI003B3AC4F1
MSATDAAVDAPVRRATTGDWVGLSVLALACLMYVMDLTVLHLALPQISEQLAPSSAQLLWIIDVYGFMVAGALVTMGTLGDRIGRRRLLMIGAVGFGLTSILAAFATTPEMLILSRALLGLAGATLAPSTLSLIFHMFADPRQRSVAIGIWIGAFSAGSAIGPVLGGLVLEHFWWGAVFLLALPVMVALLILGPIVLPEYKDPNAGRLDLLSVGLSVVAVLAVIFGLKEIAQDGVAWLPVVLIAAGLLIGWRWVRRQKRLADPMIDVGLFRIGSFRTALAVNFLAVFISVGYFLFLAQYLQLILGLSPLQSGLWSLPSAAGFIVGSQLGPRIVRRVQPALVIAVGLGLTAVGLGLLTQIGVTGGLWVIVTSSVVISLGLGPVFGLTTELIVGTAPPEKAGAASGISETAAELGGALGIAILGSVGVAIYRSQLAAGLPAGLPSQAADAAKDTLGGAVVVSSTLPPAEGAAVFDAAANAFVTGLRVVSAVATVIAVIIAVVSWFALRRPRPTVAVPAADGVVVPGTPDGAPGAGAGAGADPDPAVAGPDGRLCGADC